MSIVEKAVQWALDIANDPKHGYDQIKRWGDDYDCSSLVISAFEQAGAKVKTAGATYTGNMLSAFKKCGFKDVTSSVTLSTGKGLIRGDVLLNVKKHTAIFIGDGQIVHASLNEKGTITGGKTGDQTGKEICTRSYYNKPWDYVLRLEEKTEETTYTVKKGDTLSSIAKKYGVTVSNLVTWNGIKNPDLIRVGQKIYIKGGSQSNPIVSSPKKFIGVVSTVSSPLNIRKEPNGKIVGYLLKGTKVELYYGKINGWYELTDGRGYVSAKYIK